MRRKIKIKLKQAQAGIGAEYRVDQLVNAAGVTIRLTGMKLKKFRVGDGVTALEADELCAESNYEVTINI